MDGTESRLRCLISAQLKLHPEEVVSDADIMSDLGADSIDALELVLAIEREFDLAVPDRSAQALLTVSDVVAFLESGRSAEQPGCGP